MLEIQVYNGASYDSLDLFSDTSVDLTIPIFPYASIDERVVDYTDSFEIPATERNYNLIGILTDKNVKGRLKNGTNYIYGYLSLDNETYYTPDSKYTIYFISTIKKAIDDMRETPFSDLFRDNTETGAPDYEYDTGLYINDGGYKFKLDEERLPYSDGFMEIATSNYFSEQQNNDYPIYALDSKTGFRSLHPTFTLEKIISALFNHFNINVDLTDDVIDSYGYDDLYIRIPTNFKSRSSTTDDQNREVNISLSLDGDIGVISVDHPDESLFSYEETINSNGNDYLFYTPQQNIKYECLGNGIRNDFLSEMYFSSLAGSRNIPSYVISTTTGSVNPAIGVYVYDNLVAYYDYDNNTYNNLTNADLSNIAFNLNATYGDAIRFKVGFSCFNFSVKVPAFYDYSTGTFSGLDSVLVEVENGFYESGLTPTNGSMLIFSPGYPDGVPASLLLSKSFDKTSSYGYVNLEPKYEYVESRYGDYVLMEQSYADTDLKMKDIIDTIIERFNLSIKSTDGNSIKFVKEKDFYSSDYIVLDNKLSKKVTKTREFSNIRNISFLNEEYGNINDRVDESDNDNKILIYDVDKWLINDDNTKEEEVKFNSSLQNINVFGKRVGADEVDGFSFLKLENNTALWNVSINEKIDPNSYPITFGVLRDSEISSFRVPRSVLANDTNYPNATSEGLTENENIMVVEHTLYQTSSSFSEMYSIDDINLSDNNGSLDETNAITLNFKDYIERNGKDAVNIECEAYLTNEEIIQLRNGYKILMFGDTYKPMEISNIQFEKEGSICTILMTKETQTQDAITFDSSTITFDSTAYTMDNN